VNALSPGVIDTPWLDQLPPQQKEAIFQQAASATLVGRAGNPTDVAVTIALLIQNAFITGLYSSATVNSVL
jgi:NAD(P)-dependent dehydrogenase (short-subunit alcohol dehydrogenase family)